ncbi:BspA family leucine-rich repeat surface protein [Flavivirga eckloniae]|uniref:PKD domain-containing protein n=1 Tax=Flavivirga eckloniae TaxID=1803846 RepID=A0A2K9PNB6_9FLAO|nr:BspA family leucine-rich repeat surface protein [Flavivirga eckloniae]AUP78544.1 hypothetical protein C1H87_07395 [Flavivirga eckloniae]
MNIFRIPLIALLLMFIASCSKEDVKRSEAKELIAFTINDVKATVNQQDSALEITLPAGTDKTSLKAEVELSDNATILPDPAVARDYTNPVEFTVTAEDGSIQKYTVTVKSNPSTAFITTWKTLRNNEFITIPTYKGETYNYTVNWGDDTTSINQTGDATHGYATAGTYTVSITGDFPRVYNNGSSSISRRIQSVEQWGNQVWTSMQFAFMGCRDLQINASDAPDLSKVTDMSSMFENVTSFNGNNISSWDVSEVTNMSSMFRDVTLSSENYDEILESWSKLTLQKGVRLSVGNTTFCNGEAGRNKLINDFGWTVADGGKNCN